MGKLKSASKDLVKNTTLKVYIFSKFDSGIFKN